MGSSSEPLAPALLDTEQFAEWYRSVLPRVYGYLFKLTGGAQRFDQYRTTGAELCRKQGRVERGSTL